MTGLTEDQINHYKNKGYVSPVNALTSFEAKKIRDEIEKIEKNWPGALEGINRNYIHLLSPLFNKVCLNINILNAVESIIGQNILICGTTLFIKNPNEKGFVRFHQDAKDRTTPSVSDNWSQERNNWSQERDNWNQEGKGRVWRRYSSGKTKTIW